MQKNHAGAEYDPAKILAARKREIASQTTGRIFLHGASRRRPLTGARLTGPCEGCSHAPRCASQYLACAAFERFVNHGSHPRVWENERRIPTRSTYEAIFPGCDLRAPHFYRRDFGDHPVDAIAARRLRAENAKRHAAVFPGAA